MNGWVYGGDDYKHTIVEQDTYQQEHRMHTHTNTTQHTQNHTQKHHTPKITHHTCRPSGHSGVFSVNTHATTPTVLLPLPTCCCGVRASGVGGPCNVRGASGSSSSTSINLPVWVWVWVGGCECVGVGGWVDVGVILPHKKQPKQHHSTYNTHPLTHTSAQRHYLQVARVLCLFLVQPKSP